MNERPIDWRLLLEAPYAPTPEDAVSAALRFASLREGELVYDLGCGDGRVLITAARDFSAKAVGFEIQRELVEEARARIRNAGLDGVAVVLERDFFKEDLSEAHMVFVYLTPNVTEALGKKLRRELKDGARVVAYRYPVKGWTPHAIDSDSSGQVLFLYRLP
jgi:cyclopropane fatty-acyl-phospholipid synthase-like methyltransferase